jgi:antitoxin (DNA-binding transcriptional repressor) of toxin-antitoxin stability system
MRPHHSGISAQMPPESTPRSHRNTHGQPVVITQNGKPAGVLVSPTEYDRLTERERFLESVALGLADAEAGRTMDTKELLRRLEERRSAGR